MQGLANALYLRAFLFSDLPLVAPYCVRGGVKVVSGVATTSPSGRRELVQRSAEVLLDGTKFKGECCKDCTTLKFDAA